MAVYAPPPKAPAPVELRTMTDGRETCNFADDRAVGSKDMRRRGATWDPKTNTLSINNSEKTNGRSQSVNQVFEMNAKVSGSQLALAFCKTGSIPFQTPDMLAQKNYVCTTQDGASLVTANALVRSGQAKLMRSGIKTVDSGNVIKDYPKFKSEAAKHCGLNNPS